MLRTKTPGNDLWIGSNIYYMYNFFPKNLVNELHYWIEKQPHVNQSKNIS